MQSYVQLYAGICILSPHRLVHVQPTQRDLLNHLLAVSFATDPADAIISNVAGFVVVTDVNTAQQKMTVLAPQPAPLPNTLLLVSDIQFVDSSS